MCSSSTERVGFEPTKYSNILFSFLLCFLFLFFGILQFFVGAKSVDVDLKQQKATVTGYVEAKKVLAAAQSTKKKVELWPYVHYTVVAYPCMAYDKKAPPNHVRAVPVTGTITETTVVDRYTYMFNDENPNACSIM